MSSVLFNMPGDQKHIATISYLNYTIVRHTQ